jgi:acetyl esterase/lipase
MSRSGILKADSGQGPASIRSGAKMVDITRRCFGLAGGLAFASMARSSMAAAGRQLSRGPAVDPELMASLQAFRPEAVAGASQMMQGWVKRTIPGSNGAPSIGLYILNDKKDGAGRPAILHMHGGGFTMGSPVMSMRQLATLGDALDCVIVSVDYRLAPKTPFRGSVEDNYAALSWLYHNTANLGVDPGRIAVMGESAGGGHAALLAITARDRGEIPVLYQVLIYPMLDDRTGSTQKVSPSQGTMIWTAEQNRAGWTAFLGVPAGSAGVPVGAVPARVGDLRKLPPAYIAVGALDLFLDEDMRYGQRLIAGGVPVELHVIPGAFHGFDFVAPEAKLTKRHIASVTDALRRAFAYQSLSAF